MHYDVIPWTCLIVNCSWLFVLHYSITSFILVLIRSAWILCLVYYSINYLSNKPDLPVMIMLIFVHAKWLVWRLNWDIVTQSFLSLYKEPCQSRAV